QFIGKPLMNLLSASADGKGLRIQDGRLPAPGGSLDGAVLVGVRPEHLSVVPAGKGDLRGKVGVVEPMGSESWLEGEGGGERVAVKTLGRAAAAPGDEVGLKWDPGRVHYFDAKTERRLA